MGSIEVLPLAAAIAVLALSMFLGLYSVRKAKTLSDYWVAGRSVGVFTNASAISSNYLSAASFLGVAAVVWASGFDGVWYATGFAAGYILLLLFIASPLRRFGKYTIPDFCEGRFRSQRLRYAGVLSTAVISGVYILGQMVGVGTLMESITGLPWVLGTVLLGGIITLYVAFGGMTGVTITQMIQFWIMIVAMIAPLLVLLPRHGYAELLTIAQNDQGVVTSAVGDEGGGPGQGTATGAPAFSEKERAKFPTTSEWIRPFKKYNLFLSLSLILALVCGTAGLPHILARFYTNPDAAKARWSTVWVLVFIGVFYITTPIWGVWARMVLGPDAVLYNAAGEGAPNSLMFLTSAQAGQWAKALVAAGAIAALLSTVSGLLIALSSAIAHDLYGEILCPKASDKQKITAAKISVLGCGAVAIAIGLSFRDLNIAWVVGQAFAVAASTFFPLLVCGIWWPKMTEKGAFAGMISGGVISAGIVIAKLALGDRMTFDQPAIISIPVAFAVIFIVSKLTWSRQTEEETSFLTEAFHQLHRPEDVVRPPVAAAAPASE